MRMRTGTERGNVALPPNPTVFVARIEERQCHVWLSHITAGILGKCGYLDPFAVQCLMKWCGPWDS